MTKLVDENVAAEILGMSVGWLRQSRCHGNLENRTPAPPFVKLGRSVKYRVEDLENWITDNIHHP